MKTRKEPKYGKWHPGFVVGDSKPQHTPTPWTIDGYGDHLTIEPNVVSLGDDGGCNDPDCCGGASYHVEIQPTDAAFIVRAVNCHEELLDVAKWALKELLDSESKGLPGINNLRQAIARAEGKV